MAKSLDFWPVVDTSPVLPADPAREARVEARRRLLMEQAELITSPLYPSFLLKAGIREVREGVDQILMLIEVRQGS